MVIEFDRFNKSTLCYFVKRINAGIAADKSDRRVNLIMKSDFFSAPEVIAPLAGLIDKLKEKGFNIKIEFNENQLSSSGINSPFTVENNEYELLSPMYKVWKYSDADEVYKIVTALVKFLNYKAICAKGVVEAFEWTVNEVMDNVIQHSHSTYGYIVCTVTSNLHASIAIYDNGIGILQSFQNSKYRFGSAQEAIMAAMRENTTSNPKVGQGNGLWGMSKLIENNHGNLSITSSNAIVSIDDKNQIYQKEVKMIINTIPQISVGTLVDFQFQCNNEIDIKEVFGANYVFTNLNLEQMEDEKNRIFINVKEFSFGCATRKAGEMARIFTINCATQSNMQQQIIIDFSGVSIVASSFADEYLGKLIQHFGFIQFNNLFRIVNINESNMAIINRSITQRISEQ